MYANADQWRQSLEMLRVYKDDFEQVAKLLSETSTYKCPYLSALRVGMCIDAHVRCFLEVFFITSLSRWASACDALLHHLENGRNENSMSDDELVAIARVLLFKSNIWTSYGNLHNTDISKTCAIRAGEMISRALGPYHIDNVGPMISLSKILYFEDPERKSGDTLKKCERLMRNAAALCDKTQDTLAPFLRTLVIFNLACITYNTSTFGAEIMYRKVLDMQCRLLGKDHPITCGTIVNLANCTKDGPEKELLYKNALDVHMNSLGTEHPFSQIYMNQLALYYNRTQRTKEASVLFQGARTCTRQLYNSSRR